MKTFWADIIKSDVDKGLPLQLSVTDVIACLLMLGYCKPSAHQTAIAAATLAGFDYV